MSIAEIEPRLIAEVAERTLEAAKLEYSVWGIRDAAKARAERLDDRKGAAMALEEGVALLRAPRTDVLGQAAIMLGQIPLAPCYNWVLLGQGFVEILRDSLGMRRCLENGLLSARAKQDADDLCAIAVEWCRSIERQEGSNLLREAEALAFRNGTARPWTLANAWWSFDEDEGERVLDRALGEARSTQAALHVAQAWASHGDSARSRRAMDHAAELATTDGEWLEIAKMAFDGGLGKALVRELLSKAEALAVVPEARARVASAFKQWLHDETASRRVGPRGLPPEAHRTRVRELTGWTISASGLFDRLRALVTRDVLHAIADADYHTGADAHYAALEDICTTGLVPHELGWEPGEVLELTRWQTGEKTRHLDRALSCVLLLIASRGTGDLATDGIILAESAVALGEELTAQAELFFGWRAETVDPKSGPADDDDPEEPIACLLLFLLRMRSHPTDERLGQLALRIAKHSAVQSGAVTASIAGSMRADLWTELLSEILVPIRASRPPAETVLQALGRG